MTLPILLAVLVTNIAPDGVNTIITDTETGVTQSTCAYVWPSKEMTLEAELLPKEYRDIPGAFIPDEFRNGSPQTVIIPGSDKSYVVMSEAWYADLTNRLASTERVVYVVRSDYEKTEEGRVKLHGKRVRYSVDAENLTHTAFYEDGWHITESFAPRKANTPSGEKDAKTSVAREATPKRSTNPRYAAALKRREASKKPVEKTIIHMGGAR